jgi:predicted nucleic acid-binding protein
VGARLGLGAGAIVFENLFYESTTEVVFANKRLCERSLHLYPKLGRKISYADVVSVRIMYDRKIKSIVSFDSDFDIVDGITRVPEPSSK